MERNVPQTIVFTNKNTKKEAIVGVFVNQTLFVSRCPVENKKVICNRAEEEIYYKVKCVGNCVNSYLHENKIEWNFIKLINAKNYIKYCSFKEVGFHCEGKIVKCIEVSRGK